MSDAPPDPLERFAAWFAEACASEPDVPDAVQVATVDPDGRPSLRTVLLKGFDARGLVFYTNTESRKARALAHEPRCALLLHWKSLQRQAIVEGRAAPVSDAEADAYFASRPRGSQLGAWASLQSRPLDDRATLTERLAEVGARFAGGPVPRPPTWSGYRVVPDRWELWQGLADRLHVREVWTRDGEGWRYGLLYP